MPGLRLCLLQQEALPATPRKKSCHLAGEVSSESVHRGCRPASTLRDTLTATPRRPRGRGAGAQPRAATPPRRARKAGGDVSPAGRGMAHPERRTGASGSRGAAKEAERGGHLPSDGRERGPQKVPGEVAPGAGCGAPLLPGQGDPPHPPRAGPERAPRLPSASALRAATSPRAQTSRLHWRPRRAPALLPAPRPS